MTLRLLAALLAVCSVLASVHGAKVVWNRIQRDLCPGYVKNPEEKHEFSMEESSYCTAERQTKWRKETGRSFCDVRQVLVELNRDPQYEYHPPIVEVNRCLGIPSPCHPLKTKPRMVQVTRTDLNGNTECGLVEVIDHESCDDEK